MNYITVRERDLGGGIDAQSSENQVQPGYCENIKNADPKSTGQIAKRTGYQGYSGYLPVRVKSVEYTGTQIDFILDSSIELPIGQSSPIVVLGKTSEASGDFASEKVKYFSEFTADIKKTFSTGSNSLSFPATEHGLDSSLMFVGTAESTSFSDTSNIQFIPDTVTIDQGTKDVTIDYVNNTGSDFQGFVYAKDKSAVAGETYVQPSNIVAATDTTAFTILGSTHSLNNNSIQVKAYEEAGTDYIETFPDSVTLNGDTGDVVVTFVNSGASFNVTIILSITPALNSATGSVASGASETITIDTSVSGGSDFAFISCYLEPTIGGILEQVYPDSIVATTGTNQIVVTFTNNTATGANFEVIWDFATVVTNTLTVTGNLSASFADFEPQLTIWGLCHEEIYGTREAREGWVNHIDSYRAAGENKLVSGLGGNLFLSTLSTEGSYLMPTLYPYLNSRVVADTVIGPAFFDTGETPGRTRGYITGDNGGTNFFEITNIAYDSGTGYVDYTLTVPSMSISGTLTDIISSDAGLEDRFTARQCGYGFHNGEFVVKAVSSPTATTLKISVTNSSIDSDDYDEDDVGGLGGVFTDRITLTDTSPFLEGDKISSEIFDDTDNLVCVNSSTDTLFFSGAVEKVSIPGGLRLVGTRTSEVIPLRDADNMACVENIVRGDMLAYTGINRELRVKSINQLDDVAVSITGDGVDTATVTLDPGADTSTLFVGKSVLISGTSSYNGTITITEVSSTTTFKFASTESTTEAGTMIGKTVHVDESFAFEDTTDNSISLAVPSRWIPIEAPEDSFNLSPSTRINYFDSRNYTNQNIIRSTMVQDNLYLTNNADEVMKFDGVNLYRAGLFRWQPQFFMTTDTSGGVIDIATPPTSFSFVSNNVLTVAAGDERNFSVGDVIIGSGYPGTYSVISTSSGEIRLNDTFEGSGSGEIARAAIFQYYFRLNAVDANNNVIASAVTGSQDFTVKLAEDSAVHIKLLGMPAWDVYDYDRLEVQIYRTKAGTSAPYYRLTTLAMSFDNDDGYITYIDTDSDEDLRNLDEVTTALKGAELGTAWTNPLRAKYCTSAGNRLILGNIKDYPTLDIQVLKKQNVSALTKAVFADADNKLWSFKKDNTDTDTDTDMLNRANYEFTETVSPVTAVADNVSGSKVISFTVDVVSHGLEIGDWVYLFYDAVVTNNDLTYSGWWQVNSETTNNFTILSNVGGGSTFPNRMAKASTSTDIPVFLGTDGNYAMSNGNREAADPYEFLAMRRLANAINASMRKVDTSITVFKDFTPWMIASAGNEFNTGQIVIKQPKVFDTTLEVTIPILSADPDIPADFEVFINNNKQEGASDTSALTRLFPSRIIASYQNYPEIFDSPTAVLDTESDSAIDINSADGQEITAIIPFFGDAAFGSAQKSGIVVVFKTNSVYLVDLSAKDAGQNPVQRLETRGKGCTSPFSVAVTKGGIMFANDTGIYRLGRDLKVDYIGRKYKRIWKESVSKSQLDIATGHHDPEANSYKLSYTLIGDTENSEVAVYNHTREYENRGAGDGSWTTYDNHPTTGWSNLGSDSYFSSVDGRVYIIRRLGEDSDYRDDDAAIDMEILTRALDINESGKRKIFSKIITHYRNLLKTSEGTTLEAALDLKTVFQDTDAFKIESSTDDTGTGDSGRNKIITITSVIDEKVGVYLQLRYKNSTIDEPLEITGIDIRVADKGSEGITEAAETT